MRQFFGPRGNAAHVDEEFLLDEVLRTRTGDDFSPGDATASPNWPGVAPGTRGVLNSISPRWYNASAFAGLARKPPVTWVRGGQDQVVSDTSMFDLGYLGQLGAVPGWPGDDVLPPQPMEGQTRAVLDAYRAGGGVAEEVVPGRGRARHAGRGPRAGGGGDRGPAGALRPGNAAGWVGMTGADARPRGDLGGDNSATARRDPEEVTVMTRFGYFLSSEEHDPREIVRQAQLAEQAGFDGLWISDHFHPWLDEQGQSGFVWSMIGAISQACSLPVTTAVTCPLSRMHPAIVAQAAATSRC